ncbi:hypothetical protein RJT34_01523 [Clitoria ternatea]|uniref:Uncharacterized protein n=1 Tax=Clitoria ternatea TaxID=43366 RepID=A0AAN9KJL4_CLITE
MLHAINKFSPIKSIIIPSLQNHVLIFSTLSTLLLFARTQRNGRRTWITATMVRLFNAASILILAAVAASMVVLPLLLPPLPPPPLVLLFFPVGIMAALMLLVFSPKEAPPAQNVVD